MFFDKIHPLSFFIAFAIGLLACYVTKPTPNMVVKFPSPNNAGQVEYKDDVTDGCFRFKAEKVSCPADKSLIKAQPIGDQPAN